MLKGGKRRDPIPLSEKHKFRSLFEAKYILKNGFLGAAPSKQRVGRSNRPWDTIEPQFLLSNRIRYYHLDAKTDLNQKHQFNTSSVLPQVGSYTYRG